MFRTIIRYLFPRRVQQGQMVSTGINSLTGKEERHLYSAYSEFEFMTPDNKLFVRFVNTHGFERIPQGHPFEFVSKGNLRQWQQDGLLPWVGEIYFINNSNQTITVKPNTLGMMGQMIEYDESLEIGPGRIAVTSPLVILHSNFGVEFEVELDFVYEGELVSLNGTATRLTVDEVNQKYAAA